ncbi:chitobiase/beta-hexosaminidase C-terminal domain-containing protein [Saccharibacillus alkalitolerans]|uniref:Asl1-like glycosyl hydrolase catalytic domain-containing protein n=1 Tax=Saccharibacillus alkalitolerans TaxID=2705290 RepID=A0ABX0F061_9BACL|nr:chitobiase/beta-hexosaminidase C-terminal domain-containing protein [Saccharibacillus alkalitolerans]NGZ74392.1 hypothetical protein [Saccharibacillus alkalitolerans]
MQNKRKLRPGRLGRAALAAVLGLSLVLPASAQPRTASAAAARTITIDPNRTVQQDFLGVGVNLMPQSLMAKTQSYGYSDAHWEVDRKRILTTQPKVARVWFQIDWMEPQKGKYTWDSAEMKAFYTYLDAFKEAGTEVELNFGWKIGSKAHGWFGIEGQDATKSAPADLDAYGRSASALLNELLNKRGYDNVKYLTFYNEPNGNWDFEAPGDQKAYYAKMAAKVSEQLKKDGLRERIDIWGPEEVNAPDWTAYMQQNAGEHFDAYSFHVYGAGYDNLDDAIKLRKDAAAGKPVNLTEFGWRYDDVSGWDSGFANNVIQAANSGASSALVWQMTGVWAADPEGDVNGGFTMWDSNVMGLRPNRAFYAASLLNRYVPEHSTVIGTKTSAADIRAAAFKTESGDYAVLVESKGGEAKEITFDFGGTNVNKTFYKHEYTDDIALEGNAIVPPVSGTFKAGRSFRDTGGETDYSFAVYTTEKPQTQVQVTPVDPYVAGGETIQLNAKVIDGSGGVAWSVLGTGKGSVTAEGVYTAPKIAREDWVAVKAQSASNPKAYGIALIKVTPMNENGRAAAPSFSLKHGIYPSSEAVRISSATPGAEIRYTLNGSDPTASSSLYGGPIILPEGSTRTLKAIAVKPGLKNSAVSSSLYRTQSVAFGPEGYEFAGYEGDTIKFDGTASVAYGADGRFVYKTLTGGAKLSDETFEGDPAPGFDKRGYINFNIPKQTPVVTVLNAGFERPGTNDAAGGPMNNGWSFKPESGVQANTSGFKPPAAPEGKQTGYLKTTDGVAGEFSQSINFPAGRYVLNFQAAKRAEYGDQTFDVWFDDTKIGSYRVSDSTFRSYETEAFEATDGRHTVRFAATNKEGDNTAFIDTVSVAPSDKPLPEAPGGEPDTAVLANGSFEDPVTAKVRWNFTGGGWTFNATSGIQRNGSDFSAEPAPDGAQTAYLQTNGTRGEFSRTVDLPAGRYKLVFQAAQRARFGGIQTFDVFFDDAKIGSFKPSSGTFEALETDVFAASSGSHRIRFAASTTDGDNTAFIDDIKLIREEGQPGGAALANAGFEEPAVNGARYNFEAGGWTFDSHSGIQRSGKPFYAENAPEGSQTAYLKTDSSGSGRFAQTLDFEAGTYAIAFEASQRPGYSGIQTFDVYLDEKKIGSFKPSSSKFEPLRSEAFTVSAGSHTIRFAATSTSGDNTAFIDDLRIVRTDGKR